MDLLTTLQRNLGDTFQNRSIAGLLELLEQVLAFDSGQPDLEGVRDTILPALEQAYRQLGDVAALKLLSGELEVYLKKIVQLTEGNLGRVPTQQGKIYLKELIQHLSLGRVLNEPKVRIIRNLQTHHSTHLALDTYYTDLKCVVQAYFSATAQRFEALKKVVEPENDLTEHFKRMIKHYEAYQAVFVELNVREQIEIIGKEILSLRVRNPVPARQGTIAELRQRIPEKQMMILGQMGMGKTTTLRLLAYQDALARLDGATLPTPVYIELAAIADRDTSLERLLAQTMQREIHWLQPQLQLGTITVFIDGFNEILGALVDTVRRRIQQFIDTYPETKLLIASRPVAYEKLEFKLPENRPLDERKPIPSFLLLDMDDALVQRFIEKNYRCDAPDLQAALYEQILTRNGLLDMLRTPLYLATFLHTYDANIALPDSTTVLTERFVQQKYERQQLQNPAFSQGDFHSVMVAYVGQSPDPDLTPNPHLKERAVIKAIRPALNKTAWTPHQFLELAVDMNLLVHHRVEHSYSFAHQSYQDYYLACYYED